MATIDLSCSSANGSGFKNYAQLRITYTASNGTLKITEIAARRSDGYRSYDVYDKQISVTIGGSTKTVALDHYVDFGANSWVTWQAADTSWAGLTGNSISITATMPASTTAFSNATFKGNASMSWSTYTVSYNANGGKGAPSAQTKTHGTTLTLSSTKPTRTGYSFKGWATSASGAVAYASGASYTANAAITLYAVWKANEYTVSYNANGGTGAPGNQTKTYGTDLTLSSTEPTRLNYNFKGWGVSASATTVKYASGAKYTANEAATLYAVWELAYTKPRITKFTVARCTSNGTLADDGTFALVKFDWACDKTLSSIIIVAEGTALVKMVTASGNSGSVSQIFGDGSLSTDQTYTITVHVEDQYGYTDIDRTLNSQKFAFDALPENKGVAFGKAAELEDTADFGYKILGRKNTVLLNDKSFSGTDTDGTEYSALIPVTASGNTSLGHGLYKAEKGHTHIYGNDVQFYTKNGVHFNGSKVYFDNNVSIYGTRPDGTISEAINLSNANGNVVIGYDNWESANGNSHIYGHDLLFGVSNIATPGTFRPYVRQGTEVGVVIRTAGYVTNASTEVHFTVPLSRPVVGNPTVTVTSGNGFTLRQGNKYTHGSTATAFVTPTKYAATLDMDVGVIIIATFSDITNATNNDAIGIYWNGTITFS